MSNFLVIWIDSVSFHNVNKLKFRCYHRWKVQSKVENSSIAEFKLKFQNKPLAADLTFKRLKFLKHEFILISSNFWRVET